MQVNISPALQQAYDDQYTPAIVAWRQLGARKKAQNIISLTQGQSYSTILEVGAGDGSLLAALDQQGFGGSYTAVEIASSALQRLQASAIPRLQAIHAFDGYQLPFAPKSFDLVILSHVLEHVEHERILLRELARVGKTIYLEVPREYRYGAHKKVAYFTSYGHINIYTPSLLRFLVLTEGFQIIAERLGLYSKETIQYRYKVGSGLKKMQAKLAYLGKKLAIAVLPTRYKENFVNTIALLLAPPQ